MIKDILLLCAAFILPAIAGYLTIATLDKDGMVSRIERAALSFAVGAGLLSFYMFLIGMLGFAFSLAALLPFFLISGGIAVLLARNNRGIRPENKNINNFMETKLSLPKLIINFVFLCLIAWRIFFAIFNASTYPPYFDDAVTTWDYKAKVIFSNKSLGKSFSTDFLGGGTGSGYPLNTSLFKVWTSMMVGKWDERYIHFYNFTIFICMLILFFISLRQYATTTISLTFSYILTSIPLMAFHSYGGYADLTTGFYFFAGMLMLARWIHTKADCFLYIMVMLVAVMAFTKNEGYLIFTPAILATFLYFLFVSGLSRKEKMKKVSILVVGIIILIGPWLITKGTYNIGIGSFPIEFHKEAFAELLRVFFTEGSFNILWISAALLIILNPKGAVARLCLPYLLPTLLAFLATVAVFVFTVNFEWLWVRTTINRSLLILTPSIVFSTALLVLNLNKGCVK
ncbi:MAG: hypothetical protein HY265_05495 [Deltaproteobacteria bacterium]|nr:hypothetical protein [Deltaproteobacteria bacterium]